MENIHSGNEITRLQSLSQLMLKTMTGEISKPCISKDVNNHIHSFYSFSPYSPTEAVWKSYEAGLCAAGLVDHDTVEGAREFIEAGKRTGMVTTIGMECRADFSGTRLAGRRINNPDQLSIAYVVLHGIPHCQLDRVTSFIRPYNSHRNERSRIMTARLNNLLMSFSLNISYEEEVIPLSLYRKGGIVTERHILFALALKLIKYNGSGGRLVQFLKHDLGLTVQQSSEVLLSDTENSWYAYDLLGVLKSELLPKIYVNADKECPPIEDLGSFANSIGAVLSYPYLGDIRESVTNDKKSQAFEDQYIELLFEEIKQLGFHAVTYMPSRNTLEQLQIVMNLCEKFSLLQISGEDINSPRQSFVCIKQREKSFMHLYDTTWALIGHEIVSNRNLHLGMFSPETISQHPDLHERINLFKNLGLTLFKN